MTTRWLHLPLLFALAVPPLAGCAALLGRQAQEAPAAPVTLNDEEQAVLAATNALRAKHGLPALRPDGTMVLVARARSRDMAKRGYFAHVSPEGRSAFQVMREQKLAFAAAGENIAREAGDSAEAPRRVVADWARRPAQRANLLNGAYGRVGIGAVRTPDGRVWVTQLFAD